MQRLSVVLSAVIFMFASPSGVTVAQAQPRLGIFAGRCLTDDEVPADERAQYEDRAMQLVKALLDDRSGEIYGEFTEEVRAKLSADDFARFVKQTVPPLWPVSELRVEA